MHISYTYQEQKHKMEVVETEKGHKQSQSRLMQGKLLLYINTSILVYCILQMLLIAKQWPSA